MKLQITLTPEDGFARPILLWKESDSERVEAWGHALADVFMRALSTGLTDPHEALDRAIRILGWLPAVRGEMWEVLKENPE